MNDLGFYTNATLLGDTFFLRGVDPTGAKYKTKFVPEYSIYVPAKQDDVSDYRDIHGRRITRKIFPTVKAAKGFVDDLKFVDNFKLYFNHRYQYGVINDLFPGKIQYDASKIDIGIIDIEVESENDFAKPDDPTERINAITYAFNNQFFVFGYTDFDLNRLEHKNGEIVEYFKCENETDLFLKFLKVWRAFTPHIISGWNTNGYDLPYIVRRAGYLGLDEQIKHLSPWNRVTQYQEENKYKTLAYKVDILGVQCLDYQELYQKFCMEKRETYKLEFIAQIEELDERKIDYSEIGSLRDLYKKDPQLFLEYNIGDVKTVRSLDRKMRLFDLAFHLCYDAKVEFEDVLSQMRMWETRIMNRLLERQIVPEQKFKSKTKDDIIGGFVKDADIGTVDWTVSIDLNSLYPSLIMMLNVSPETLIDDSRSNLIDLDQIIKTKKLPIDLPADQIFAANTTRFTNTKVGFLPEMVDEMYNDRKFFKNKQLEAETRLQLVEKELKRRKV